MSVQDSIPSPKDAGKSLLHFLKRGTGSTNHESGDGSGLHMDAAPPPPPDISLLSMVELEANAKLYKPPSQNRTVVSGKNPSAGIPNRNRQLPAATAAQDVKEEIGSPASGQLRNGSKAFEIQVSGSALRNSSALSTHIQKSLRFVICKDGLKHCHKAPTASQHLVLINAALLMQPRENCTMWYSIPSSAEAIDIVEYIEGSWAGANSTETNNIESSALLTFPSSKVAAWPQVAKHVWVLFSLPGRRLVTQKDGRLLLLGGFLRKKMHIGTSSGSWFFSTKSAREEEICTQACWACSRAGILTALENTDESLYWEKVVEKPRADATKVAVASAKPSSSQSNAFGGLADDSSDEDDD